jgi:hypothetical protein
MAHTSEGAKDAWRIPKPHSSGNDTGAGADAQPHDARVGPFRAPATGKLSDQRLHLNFNATATFVAAANRSASSAKGAIAWRCGSDSVPLAALRDVVRGSHACRRLRPQRHFLSTAFCACVFPFCVPRLAWIATRSFSCFAEWAWVRPQRQPPPWPCTQVCRAQLGTLFAQSLCSGPLHLCNQPGHSADGHRHKGVGSVVCFVLRPAPCSRFELLGALRRARFFAAKGSQPKSVESHKLSHKHGVRYSR